MARGERRRTGAPPGRAAPLLTTDNVGFLLAKASQRWNELLHERFVDAGFAEVRAAYGALLVPLYEQDGLRLGELARRARLSKQTLTTMARALERDGLIERRPDPADARATLVHLSARGRALRPVVERALRELEGVLADAVPTDRHEELREALRAISNLGASQRERRDSNPRPPA